MVSPRVRSECPGSVIFSANTVNKQVQILMPSDGSTHPFRVLLLPVADPASISCEDYPHLNLWQRRPRPLRWPLHFFLFLLFLLFLLRLRLLALTLLR